MTWIKICGTTNLEDALMCAEAGADALGFVFADSPRKIDAATAAKIAASVPAKIEKVGVFVLPSDSNKAESTLSEAFERIEQASNEAGLTALQLYCDCYPFAWQSRLAKSFKIIRAVNYPDPGDFLLGRKNDLHAVLLDSGDAQSRGGTGQPFDWESVPDISGYPRAGDYFRIIVAGGLTPTNVSHAMKLMHPWGVDVVSGVERGPGKKDPAKVKAFIQAVRKTDREQ